MPKRYITREEAERWMNALKGAARDDLKTFADKIATRLKLSPEATIEIEEMLSEIFAELNDGLDDAIERAAIKPRDKPDR